MTNGAQRHLLDGGFAVPAKNPEEILQESDENPARRG